MKRALLIHVVLITIFLGVACHAQSPEEIKLKSYRANSIYKIPVAQLEKAKFP